MPRYKLIVLPNGKTVIASSENLTDEELAVIRDAWEQAQKDDAGLVIISDCEVIVAGAK